MKSTFHAKQIFQEWDRFDFAVAVLSKEVIQLCFAAVANRAYRLFALHGHKQAGTVGAVDGTEDQEDGAAINAVQAGGQCGSQRGSQLGGQRGIQRGGRGGRIERWPQGWLAGQRLFCTGEDP